MPNIEQTQAFYTSEPMRIGKHEWRVRVVASLYFTNECCLQYQWRPKGETMWRYDNQWSNYNGNDAYGGLPKSLAKLYERNKATIKLHLDVTSTATP